MKSSCFSRRRVDGVCARCPSRQPGIRSPAAALPAQKCGLSTEQRSNMYKLEPAASPGVCGRVWDQKKKQKTAVCSTIPQVCWRVRSERRCPLIQDTTPCALRVAWRVGRVESSRIGPESPPTRRGSLPQGPGACRVLAGGKLDRRAATVCGGVARGRACGGVAGGLDHAKVSSTGPVVGSGSIVPLPYRCERLQRGREALTVSPATHHQRHLPPLAGDRCLPRRVAKGCLCFPTVAHVLYTTQYSPAALPFQRRGSSEVLLVSFGDLADYYRRVTRRPSWHAQFPRSRGRTVRSVPCHLFPLSSPALDCPSAANERQDGRVAPAHPSTTATPPWTSA